MEENKPSVNTSYKKSSFGPAFFFVSKRRRTALAAYYEFCRLMDDIADEPNVKDPLKELDFWQEEVARIFNHTPQTPLGQQLAQAVDEFAIGKESFVQLIEGMRDDLKGKIYHTQEELNTYLYRVAVVVGLATLDILEVSKQPARTLAENLGRAVQLTNIIRDVCEDAKLNRVYLPVDLLTKYGLTRDDILAGKSQEKTSQVLAELAQTARAYYQKAFAQMKTLPRLKMLPCRMMGCVYAKNLAKISKSGFIVSRSVKLTKAEKLIGVVYACSQTVLG